MRRREFIGFLGGAAIAWSPAARAQHPERTRRIVFLHALAENDPEVRARVKAFRQGLEALGWTENHNIQIEHRFSGGDLAQIQAHTAELVSSAPDLIVASSTPVIAALKQATRTIPIVFSVVNDPLGQGFVASLARPGGNITGFTFVEFTMVGKWLEMLKEIAPSLRRVALIFNPQTAPYYPIYLHEFGAVPATLAAELVAAPVRDEAEVEAAVAALAREPAGGSSSGVRLRMSIAFSRGRSRPTFPCRRRPSSNWSSTSKLPKHSTSPSHLRCLRKPTR